MGADGAPRPPHSARFRPLAPPSLGTCGLGPPMATAQCRDCSSCLAEGAWRLPAKRTTAPAWPYGLQPRGGRFAGGLGAGGGGIGVTGLLRPRCLLCLPPRGQGDRGRRGARCPRTVGISNTFFFCETSSLLPLLPCAERVCCLRASFIGLLFPAAYSQTSAKRARHRPHVPAGRRNMFGRIRSSHFYTGVQKEKVDTPGKEKKNEA